MSCLKERRTRTECHHTKKTREPTYGTGFSTIRIPRRVRVVAVEVYAPAATQQREKAREAAERLGVGRKAFDRDRADWRRYRTLGDAELGGFIEVIPEQDGGQIVILHGDVINIILS